MNVGTHRLPLTWLLATTVAATAACSDLLGPPRHAHPQLRTLVIGGRLVPGGYLSVEASPWDPAFRLRGRQRVPAELVVTSGDTESVALGRRFCPERPRVPHYDCFSFDVMMQEGHTLAELRDRVAAIGGRLASAAVSGGGSTWYSLTFGWVVLFSSEDLVQRARDARSWPGVAVTDLSWAGGACLGGGCGELPLGDLRLPLPLDSGAARVRDGVVQARSGDTIAVRYRQPYGATLEARAVMP